MSTDGQNGGGGAAPRIEGFALGPYETNCYIVSVPGSDRCWIVDAGFWPGELIGAVTERGLRPEALILTHAHADHIAGVEEVRAVFSDVPVLIHENEAEWLTNPALNLSQAGGMPVVTKPADRTLRGGETLELAGTKWRVLNTPGHSPGGITLYHEPSRQAIVGDALFAGSVGRTDFPTSDHDRLIGAIRENLYTLPDETRVYPGHGPETTIGREKRSNPFVRGE